MPSHTDYWIGRYEDAGEANARAVAVDLADAGEVKPVTPNGAFDQPYHAHNVHFGVGRALMAGDAKDALTSSTPVLCWQCCRTSQRPLRSSR